MNTARPKLCLRACCVLLVGLIAVSTPPTGLPFAGVALADGPTDNSAENVRPIPPLGLEIADEATAALQRRCQSIRGQWDALVAAAGQSADAKKNVDERLAQLEALTPEILVFPRAVEMAIEFQQFYKPTDPQRAWACWTKRHAESKLPRAGAAGVTSLDSVMARRGN